MALPITIPAALLATTCLVWAGLLLHIIGLSTPHWMDTNYWSIHPDGSKYTDHGSYGMFEACGNGKCTSLSAKWLPDYYKASQAMILLGMISAIVAASMTVVACVYSWQLKPLPKTIAPVCVAAGIATVTFTMICIAVWCAKFYSKVEDKEGPDGELHYSLGYSFGLVIVGAVLVLVGGGVFCFGTRSVSHSGEAFIPIA